MKAIFCSLVIMLFLPVGCAFNPVWEPLGRPGPAAGAVVERDVDLGHGFRRVVLAEHISYGFESIGHFEYIYYRDLRLGRVDDCSVSPSGNYAIYQEASEGNLFLFRCSDQRSKQLTRRFIELTDLFRWHEEARTVEVQFPSEKSVRVFALE